MTADVVFVHGIWMPGAVMAYQKQHLERAHGFRGHLFSYPSIRGTLDENVWLLAEFVNDIKRDTVHLVGHSLGGVLVLRMLAMHDDAPRGRVVCLGSPLSGCLAAKNVRRFGWGSHVLGRALVSGVLDDAASSWAGPVTATRDVGIIAGTRPLGFGRLVAAFDEDHDGTVGVSETLLPGATDHISLPVSHIGMVLSRDVADQSAAFIEHGRFLR